MTREDLILACAARLFLITALLSLSSLRIFAAEGGGEFVPWREVRQINAHEHHVESVRFSPDGARLASTSSWGTKLSIWNVASGKSLRRKRSENIGVVLSPDWETTAHIDRTEQRVVELWEFPGEKVVHALNVVSPRALTFSRTGELVACGGGGDGKITLWRVRDGKRLWTIDAHRRCVTCLEFDPRGNVLASGGPDSAVRIWQVGDGTLARTLQIDDQVTSLAFTRDGALLAAGTNGRLKLWRTRSGSVLHERWYGIYFTDLAFSKDAKLLAVCSTTDVRASASLRLLRVADLNEIQVLVKEMSEADCIEFSPDGKMLAAGCSDGTVRLFSPTE